MCFNIWTSADSRVMEPFYASGAEPGSNGYLVPQGQSYSGSDLDSLFPNNANTVQLYVEGTENKAESISFTWSDGANPAFAPLTKTINFVVGTNASLGGQPVPDSTYQDAPTNEKAATNYLVVDSGDRDQNGIPDFEDRRPHRTRSPNLQLRPIGTRR